MKKIFLFIILLMPGTVLGWSDCDRALVSKYKKLLGNINISYTYKMENNDVLYDVTLSNIQSDMYFMDTSNSKKYYYSDTNNGEITISNYEPGTVKYIFFLNNSECEDQKLNVLNVNLPYYNRYYNLPECQGKENYKLCNRWIKYDGTEDEFLYQIKRYESNDDIVENDDISLSWFNKIISLYTTYYYILLPLTIFIVVGILYLIKYIKNRLNRFDI